MLFINFITKIILSRTQLYHKYNIASTYNVTQCIIIGYLQGYNILVCGGWCRKDDSFVVCFIVGSGGILLCIERCKFFGFIYLTGEFVQRTVF